MDKYKIKPELKDEWEKAVGMNCGDSYSFGVVRATCAAFGVLDDPKKTPKDAEKAWKGMGLTGYMAGASAGWIARFHVRGEEFNDYWNKQFGVTPEKAKGGTVNPAIVTIET